MFEVFGGGCMNTEHWQCPAAELSCSPQMASSRAGNIFHLFSSFSVWRQFTLHCAASLSSIYFSVQRWVAESRSREMNQSDMPPSVHSSSTPMKGCLPPPLQSVLLCCPIVHSSVPVSCVYSSVHSSVAMSAVIWTWTHKISSWQWPGPSPVSWSHSPLTPHINIAGIRSVFQYWIAIILLRFLVTQFQLQETRYNLVYVLGCRRLWAIGSIVISAAIEKDVLAWPEDARRLSTL